jgi:hypothetical protein
LSHLYSLLIFRDTVVRPMIRDFFAFSILAILRSPGRSARLRRPFRLWPLSADIYPLSVPFVLPGSFSGADFTSSHFFCSSPGLLALPITLACASIFAHLQPNHTLH